jgi:ribosome-binding protein aMBF1 (putative translation factor)
MLEPTKKHRTEDKKVNLRLVGPLKNKVKAIKILRKLGFVDISDSIPWRDAFPELDEEPEYSIALRGARAKEGLTQAELAQKANVPQGHISQMENGKMSIGKERAQRFAKVLNVNYRVFL